MSEQPPPARAHGGFRGATAPAYPRIADPVTAEPDPLRPITVSTTSPRCSTGWACSRTCRPSSSSAGDDDLRSEEFRAEARRRNQLDLELHRYATAVFARHRDRYTDAVLAPDHDDGPLDLFLRTPEGRAGSSVPAGAGSGPTAIWGWVTIAGAAPDAVLLRTSAGVTPLCCRIDSSAAVRNTRAFGARAAGGRGRVLLSDSDVVDLIAVDRTRGLRAERSFTVRAGELP